MSVHPRDYIYIPETNRRSLMESSDWNCAGAPVCRIPSSVSFLRSLGQVGGQATSKAKKVAARANGKLGGRPRKVLQG